MSKTYIDDIDRSIYDMFDKNNSSFSTVEGLSKEIVIEISKLKNEPKWMLDLRLESLKIFTQRSIPNWGPDLSELDINKIIHYVKPNTELKSSWKDIPEDIKNTFERLGIPQAEQASLSGVGAQYDSEVVYHSIKKELVNQGVVYLDMETAVNEYEEIVKKHFMKLIPPNAHTFAALHGAVWSGGSFVYVPKDVKVDIPLQSYFRLNAKGAGQFEHTLIIVEENAYLHFIEGCSAPKYSVQNLHAGAVELFVNKNATLRYSTIENWSKNMYNLNTKRALVKERGSIEWVSGSFGSKISMLYPMSILKGDHSKSEFTGITFASKGQILDTGCKVVLSGKNTSCTINSKSISKSGGKAFYRGLLEVGKNASNAKASVNCESLMLDNESQSDTLPIITLLNDNIDIGHEAKIGRISDEAIFYLMSRGISKEEAKAMIVRGFVEPITKELPLEYAVELNHLIDLELEGTIG